MDRLTTLGRLATTEKHIQEGDARIRRQREIIEQIERPGQNPSAAQELLDAFERLQLETIAERERLKAKLAASQ